MNIEGGHNINKISSESELAYEVRQHKEGITLYVFKDLAVAIDTTGKNYKALPELLFGPFNNELNTGSLNQPEIAKQSVNMEYISKCIRQVALASGIHQFWIYPFGGDVDVENKERREKARIRLFAKTLPMQPAPEGHGYIITV